MQINVKSALYGMQEVLPHFNARGDGHIINVPSMLGRAPFAVIRSAYCGAKHLLNAHGDIPRGGPADPPGHSVSIVLPARMAGYYASLGVDPR